MAWIYLAELVDSDSRLNLGCELSAIVNLTDMHRAFYCPECDQATLTPRLYGTMCDPSRKAIFHPSTLSSAASPAKTSPQLELAEDLWLESEADFILKSKGLSEKQTRDLYFSKTSRQLELVASTQSSSHLPSSGMIVAGRLYQPKKLEPRTYAKGGFYLPTPTAIDPNREYQYKPGTKIKVYGLCGIAKNNLWPTPVASPNANRTTKPTPSSIAGTHGKTLAGEVGGPLNPQFVEWLMMFPVEWTVLDASVTAWFHSKRKSRSKDSPASKETTNA